MLDKFFNAKSIAVIGVSKNPNKVGHVIFRNLIDGNYEGKVFAVNPNADYILNYKAYRSVLDIKDSVELAVIAIPATLVLRVIKDCSKKKIRNVVIISSGFKEIGNVRLESKLQEWLKKYGIRAIGTNCLGILNMHNHLDTLFLPRYRLKRPGKGRISFICQSGAVGSAILDLASEEGYGFSKFASYGNATDVDESDLIDYLSNDTETGVICLYIEGIKDGRKFMRVVRKTVKKKPIIAIKGGLTDAGSKAVMSHTGSLAGSAETYLAAFKQTGIIVADSLEDMFNYARILEKAVKPKGKRIQIITNGGGYGILAADALLKNNLVLAELSREKRKLLEAKFPRIAIVKNPMDLVGDATTERYKLAIEACISDDRIDIILIILLLQTPLISTDIVDVISEFNDLGEKPIVVVSTGGEFTKVLKRNLEENNIPCFMFPENAVRAIKQLVDYYRLK